MTITKVIIIPALLALLLGLGVSYLAASFQGQESFKVHKVQIEENAKKRREEICEEIDNLLPDNPTLAMEVIESEINELDKRKTTRWQE